MSGIRARLTSGASRKQWENFFSPFSGIPSLPSRIVRFRDRGNRMAYNEQLASRIRQILKRKRNLEEKKMFGGLTFMLNGHMCCGVEKNNLMVRVPRDRYQDLLKKPHARVMDLTGRPLKGFIFVGSDGVKMDSALKFWIDQAVQFVRSQPPKKAKPRSKSFGKGKKG